MGWCLDSTCVAWRPALRLQHVVVLGLVARILGVARWCVCVGVLVRGRCLDLPCVAQRRPLRLQHGAVLCWGALVLGIAQWCGYVGKRHLGERWRLSAGTWRSRRSESWLARELRVPCERTESLRRWLEQLVYTLLQRNKLVPRQMLNIQRIHLTHSVDIIPDVARISLHPMRLFLFLISVHRFRL